MGSIRFERQPPVEGSNKNVLEFDSSPDRAISQAYGLEEGSIELRKTEDAPDQRTFEVFARNIRATPQSPPNPLIRRGILKQITPQEIMRRQSNGIIYGRAFR